MIKIFKKHSLLLKSIRLVFFIPTQLIYNSRKPSQKAQSLEKTRYELNIEQKTASYLIPTKTRPLKLYYVEEIFRTLQYQIF